MPRTARVPRFLRPPARRVRRLLRAFKRRLRPATSSTAPTRPSPSPAQEPEPTGLGRRLVDADAVPALRRTRQVSVIVPIFNAAIELQKCLDALARNSPPDVEFLLIDDASTDPAVTEILERFASRDTRARQLRNEANLGFTATVNRGFGATEGDVVLLNSDTQVPPRWLANLRLAAYQDATIGTVTPLSDNSGAFSAPVRDEHNPLPEGLSHDEVGRLVWQKSARRYPKTPTGGGFCLYVKRAVLDSVGYLDEQAFPRGYGEENDLCIRATDAGWEHIVDDATYVFHARGASFGPEKAPLVAAGQEVLRRRYPDYEARVGTFLRDSAMESVRQDVRATFESAPSQVLPRVLNVVHAAGGGTPATVRDLAVALNERWDAWIFESDGETVRVLRLDGQAWTLVREHRLSTPIRFGQRTDTDYRKFVTEVLSEHAIDLVHVRHLIKHPLHDVTEIAAAFGLPYLVSFHDYYFSCPTIHLLDDQDRFCAGRCTPGQGRCRPPMRWIDGSAPHLKHAWVHTWREAVTEAFSGAAGLITTAEEVRDIVRDSLPALAGLPFHVIEHGRDLQQERLAVPPTPGEPLRILVPGHLIGKHKGIDVLRALKQADEDERFELHLLGQAPDRLADLGVLHGQYEREEFLERVRDIRPSFAAILSPWGETYCHTLTESWAAGLPAIVADRGALRERVQAHGGGVLIDPDDLPGARDRILTLADDPEAYSEILEEVYGMRLRTSEEMAIDYDRTYRVTF